MSVLQVFSELHKILADISDPHTDMNYFDGHLFPLQFRILGDDVCIIDTDTTLSIMHVQKHLISVFKNLMKRCFRQSKRKKQIRLL